MKISEQIAKEKEAHFIMWCCREMKQAKTGADVYRIMTIWANHVSKSHDWLIKECIPKELQ